MSPWREQFLSWCKSEREQSAGLLEMLRDGTLRTRSQTGGDPWVDTTDTDIATHEGIIRKMDDLIAKIEEDEASA